MTRVGAYCRVSTDQEDQANSFANQQRYFRDYIERNPDWVLQEIYADEGLSGTSTKKRDAFNRMIQDARMGQLDLILTKEVSRFARNTLDTLEYTRELRRLGVGVIFLLDNIDTRASDGELRLTIMSSLAQEESRKTSERVKWGQTRRMEQGVVFGGSLLGYRVERGQIEIISEEAALVRHIFTQYLDERKGTSTIARELQEKRILSSRGNCRWSGATVLKILKNEKYCGDLVQKKTYTPDFLSHDKKYNHGQEQYIVLRNHHEPIIERPIWEAVQKEIKRRARKVENQHQCGTAQPFSGKIWCGVCGSCFVSRLKKNRQGTSYRVWRCGRAVREGAGSCSLGCQLRDDDALFMVQESLTTALSDREQTGKRLAEYMEAVLSQQGERDSQERCCLEQELERERDKKEEVLGALLAHVISEEDFRFIKERCDTRIERISERLAKKELLPPDRSTLEKIGSAISEIMTVPEGEFCGRMLERMTVFQNGRVEVRLKGTQNCWTFLLGSRLAHDDSSVPISVNNPLASEKGME